MKILLLGGSGQLGTELIEGARALNFEITYPVSSELDISDTEHILSLVKNLTPDVVVNSAAYTAVDLAEQESDLANEINGYAIARLAKALKDQRTRLIHFSTDYVFDGKAKSPRKEEDECNPISVYGKSKLIAEQAIRAELGEQALIVRTSSLHGRAGQNIVHTLLRLFQDKRELSFVSDQIMSPTWTGWLAEVVLDLIRIEVGGTIHACCAGEVSWYQFAKEVWRQAQAGRPYAHEVEIKQILAKELKRPAARPAYSVMCTDKLASVLGRDPLWWEDGIARHLAQIDYRDPFS